MPNDNVIFPFVPRTSTSQERLVFDMAVRDRITGAESDLLALETLTSTHPTRITALEAEAVSLAARVLVNETDLTRIQTPIAPIAESAATPILTICEKINEIIAQLQ